MSRPPATPEEIKAISDAKEHIGRAINLLASIDHGSPRMVATQLRQFHTTLVQMQWDAGHGDPY